MNRFHFLFLLAPLLMMACSSTSEYRQNSSDTAVRGQKSRTKSVIPKISAENLYAAAQKAYQAKDYEKSYDYFQAAAKQWAGSPRELESLYWSLRAAGKMNNHGETLETANNLLKTKTWSAGQLSEIYAYKHRALESEARFDEEVLSIETALALPQLAREYDSLKIKANELISNRMSPQQLQDLSASSNQSSFKALAYFRLAEFNLDARDSSEARSNLSRCLGVADPNSDLARRAKDLLEQLEAVRRVEPKTIGVVLPMTGKYAAMSQKTLRGIQLGLGLSGQAPSSFKLAIVDSEGNPDLARKGVEKLVKEDNTIAIVGSLLSKTAPAVASKASELGVPSIALSQKYGITELGPSVFRNSLTSEMQVRHLVRTAMEDMGLRKFAILYPNDAYGVEFANLFWDEVLARGGSVTAAQIYSPKETDFKDVIQRLVGTYYVEARADEYKLRLKDWSLAQTKKSARNLPPEDLLPPIVDFDGVFIPDNAKALGQISAMLAFNGVKSVKLLGTNLWNVPGLAKRAGNSAQQIVFVDSFVNTDPRFEKSSFVRDFRSQFNEDPGVFEVQAYDSALILRQLIAQGATSRESLARSLASLRNFPGSLGELNMSEDREVLRPVMALGLESGSIVPIRRSTQK